jgi:sortase A
MRKRLLLYFGCALIIGGALALGWYAYLRVDALRVQRAASRLLDQQKMQHEQSVQTRSVPHAIVVVPPRPGEPIGRLEIPRLHVSAMVLEGTTSKVLRVAAGHVTGTALPGAAGNVAIAAHRDTFFRALRDVRDKDLILVTTPYGTFRYVVEATEIVNPTDVEVLRRTHHPELTLVTCYPFIYIGAAPKRFVVHAQQEG